MAISSIQGITIPVKQKDTSKLLEDIRDAVDDMDKLSPEEKAWYDNEKKRISVKDQEKKIANLQMKYNTPVIYKIKNKLTKTYDKYLANGQWFKASFKAFQTIGKKVGSWLIELLKFIFLLAIFDPKGKFLRSIVMFLTKMVVWLIKIIAKYLPGVIVTMINLIVDILPGLIVDVFNALNQALYGMFDAWMKKFPKDSIMYKILKFTRDIFGENGYLKTGLVWIYNTIKDIWSALQPFFEWLVNKIFPIIKEFFLKIFNIFSEFKKNLSRDGILIALGKLLWKMSVAIWTAGIKILKELIIVGVPLILKALWDVFKWLLKTIWDVFKSISGWVISPFISLFNFIKKFKINTVLKFIEGIWKSIKGFFSNLVSDITKYFKSTTIFKTINLLIKFFNVLKNTSFTKAIKMIGVGFKSVAKGAKDWVASGVTSAWQGAKQTAGNMYQSAKKAVGGAVDWTSEIATKIKEAIKSVWENYIYKPFSIWFDTLTAYIYKFLLHPMGGGDINAASYAVLSKLVGGGGGKSTSELEDSYEKIRNAGGANDLLYKLNQAFNTQAKSMEELLNIVIKMKAEKPEKVQRIVVDKASLFQASITNIR